MHVCVYLVCVTCMFSLALLLYLMCFSIYLALGEGVRANRYAPFSFFVYLVCVTFLYDCFASTSRCQELAAACECGTPWTLTFYTI